MSDLDLQRGSPRTMGIDAARAAAVVAMVVGHTADALLAQPYKDTTAFALYVGFRGMTAPLFLFVSGWAVITRALRMDLGGAEVFRKHVPRACLLILLGAGLRWPGWDVAGVLAGRAEVWRHWWGMDALSCIGVCLLLSTFVLAPRTKRWARAAMFAALLVIASGASLWFGLHPPQQRFAQWLVGDPESPFPLLPWAGYFFGGACAGVFVQSIRAPSAQAAGLLVLGAVGLTLVDLHGLDGLASWSPWLFLYRLAFAASIGGVALALPPSFLKGTSLMGRASLQTYVLHLPLVYGWGMYPGLRGNFGASLDPFQTAAVALGLLCLGALSKVRLFRPSVPESLPARDPG